MSIAETIKATIEAEGRTQKWIVSEMNKIDSSINMNETKFSAILKDRRKMQGNELLAFCKATGKSPDIFIEN